jgi:hypothetical protein
MKTFVALLIFTLKLKVVRLAPEVDFSCHFSAEKKLFSQNLMGINFVNSKEN